MTLFRLVLNIYWLQYAIMEKEGLRDFVTCSDIRWRDGRHSTLPGTGQHETEIMVRHCPPPPHVPDIIACDEIQGFI